MSAQTGSKKALTLHRTGFQDAAAITSLLVLSLAFFWKAVFTNQVLTGIDLFSYFYPYRDFATEALRQGRLPLWNPHLFMGVPLLANSQVAVLYPPHWPLIWLPVPKQIAWSIVSHIWLAGAGTYLYARCVVHLRPLSSLVGAAVFALGGFLGAQVEHVNQLNTSAWLPWLLVSLEATGPQHPRLRRRLAFLSGSAVTSFLILAGHTQAAYIVLVGAGCYTVLRGIQQSQGPGWRRALQWLRGPAMLAGMAMLALLLSAGQLLPTIELSRLSVRSGGLEYREAASFSLRPGQVPKALLPPIAWEPPFSEYVAYVGLCGLGLGGLGGVLLAKSLRRQVSRLASRSSESGHVHSFALSSLGLTLLGLFLAFGAYNPVYYILYKIMPGIALFRAPSRWLLLYAFGMAILTAIGSSSLSRISRLKKGVLRCTVPLVALLLLAELFTWSRKLAYNHPTAPAAYDSLRTATAHLLADDGEPFRFLSLSDILYDPGDLGDLQAMFARDLSDQATYDLVVATKMKEVLAYNLPLRYRLYSVDGYDGGLLPTKRYIALERLFLEESEIWPDGRLRQQLAAVPPVRLLSLLNVRYIITDKSQDAWHEGVYYDLETELPLQDLKLTSLPDFEATQLGIVSYLTATASLPNGTPVAEVALEVDGSVLASTTLRAGYDTAEGLYDVSPVTHSRGVAIHNWRGDARGSDYLAILDLPRPTRPGSLHIRSLLPKSSQGRFVLRGLSLIDGRTGTSASISVDPALKLVHSGDVKIYKNLVALPRAFIVHQSRISADEASTIAQLRDVALNPAQQVILSDSASAVAITSHAPAVPDDSPVQVLRFGAERIDLRATLKSPGYLVLTEAYYPGWEAEIDGRPAPIVCADAYFRAVALDTGKHTVTFQYRPGLVRWGLGVGAAGWVLWALLLAIWAWRAGRKNRHHV